MNATINIAQATGDMFAIPWQSEDEVKATMRRLWYIDTTRMVNVRNNIAGPFQTEERFYAEALNPETWPVRKYTIEGHKGVALYVPIKDLPAYEKARQTRFAPGAVEPSEGWTTLPEDVVAYLDDLPDSSIFPEISLYLDNNPVDDWPRELGHLGSGWRSLAAAIKDRELAFHRVRHYDLRFCGIHECFHRLARLYPEIFKLLHVARFLDSTYIPTTYAHTSEEEHGTTFGQNLLGLNGYWFLNVVRGGPFRSFILMTMVERWMQQAAAERPPCRCHDYYVKRIEFARAYVEQHLAVFVDQVHDLMDFLASNGVHVPSLTPKFDRLSTALMALMASPAIAQHFLVYEGGAPERDRAA